MKYFYCTDNSFHTEKNEFHLRGHGGLHQDFFEIDFLVVSDRVEGQLSETIHQIKNIVPSLKYRWSKVNAVLCAQITIFNCLP